MSQVADFSLDFEGRVALVTGAGGGLGLAHVRFLAARGAAVCVNDVDAEAAQRVADEIASDGGAALADTHSVAEPESAAALVAAALEHFGRIDVLINNAGVIRRAPFEALGSAEVREVLDVHLAGAFWVTRPVWAAMREQGYGRIVNTTSNHGLFGATRSANYSAAKMGLVGFTRALALEGRRLGIRVNAVAPLAHTSMMEEGLEPARRSGASDDVTMRLLEHLDPDRVSALVTYLAHESCDVSGEVFSAGGGHFARVFIVEGAGWTSPTAGPEDIAAHMAEIRAEAGWQSLPHALAELELIERALNRASRGIMGTT
jgi:NAD(P)-dependent dehydrogenase (short-subunit alcohol dehydrogenase family)